MSRRDSLEKRAQFACALSALGDETRLALVEVLAAGESKSITELAAGSDISRQAITKHLRVLENAHLVTQQKQGRERRYELCPDALESVHDSLSAISRRWAQSLKRLKMLAENTSLKK